MRALALVLAVVLAGCAQIAGLSEHVAADDGGSPAGDDGGSPAGDDGGSPAGDDGGSPAGNDAPLPRDGVDAATTPVDKDAGAPPLGNDAAIDHAGDAPAVPGPEPDAGGPRDAGSDRFVPTPSRCLTDGGASCPIGLGNCRGTGCNVSLSSDPDNCGACGRSCRGGECMDGECQPLTVTSGHTFGSRPQLAISASGIYWGTHDGRLYSLSFAPGAMPVLLAQGEGQVQQIVVDAEFAYFMTQEGPCVDGGWCLRRVSLIPGKYPPLTLRGVGGYSTGLVVDASALYWLDTKYGSVYKLPTRQSQATVQELATNQRGPTGVVDMGLDAEWVYWATTGATESVVKRIRIDGTSAAPQRLAVADGISSVAIDGVNVYWTDYDARAIQYAPKDGSGPVTTLAVVDEKDGPPVTIAVDEVNVYWGSDGGHGGVWKVAKCGGPYVHAAGGGPAFGLVPWQGSLYWNDNISRIQRVAQ